AAARRAGTIPRAGSIGRAEPLRESGRRAECGPSPSRTAGGRGSGGDGAHGGEGAEEAHASVLAGAGDLSPPSRAIRERGRGWCTTALLERRRAHLSAGCTKATPSGSLLG